jgi:mono/diheme cytochrome c family protein
MKPTINAETAEPAENPFGMTSMNPVRLLLYFASAFLLSATLAVSAQTPSAPDDQHPNFPAGEGRELTIKVCSTCHGLDVVAEQQLDLDGWKNTVDQMASMGADATEAQLDQIVHYLAKAFPESK